MSSKNTEKLTDFRRIGIAGGQAHATTDYTLSSGFGSTATVTLTGCTDAGGRVTITCSGTGFGANPTLTLAYKDVMPDRAPHVFTTRGGGSQATIILSTTSEFTTGCIITFNGTASNTETYTFNYLSMA